MHVFGVENLEETKKTIKTQNVRNVRCETKKNTFESQHNQMKELSVLQKKIRPQSHHL